MLTNLKYCFIEDYNCIALEPQWLVIISLLQNKNKNEYHSTVTKLWGNDAVNRWLKNQREVQDGIVVFESTNFQKKRSNEILRNRNGSLWWDVWIGHLVHVAILMPH